MFTAQRINRQMGGAVVAPWDLGQLTEDWEELFYALDGRLPKWREKQGEIEAAKAKIRREHPAFRK